MYSNPPLFLLRLVAVAALGYVIYWAGSQFAAVSQSLAQIGLR